MVSAFPIEKGIDQAGALIPPRRNGGQGNVRATTGSLQNLTLVPTYQKEENCH
jgi:hypothetical protein